MTRLVNNAATKLLDCMDASELKIEVNDKYYL